MQNVHRRRWMAGLVCGWMGLVCWQIVAGQLTAGDESGPVFPTAQSAAGLQVVPLTGGRYVGVGSCAASGCHGGNGSHGVVRSEYSVWIERDRHANAYSV